MIPFRMNPPKKSIGTINIRVVQIDGGPTQTFQVQGDTIALHDDLSNYALDALDEIWGKVSERVSARGALQAERDWPSRTITFYVK